MTKKNTSEKSSQDRKSNSRAKKVEGKTKSSGAKSTKKKENRQSGERIPVNLLVDYKSKNGHYLFDFCKDLGAGGIFIQTDDPLNMGEELSLTFTLPDSKKTLITKGKVMWVQNRISEKPDLTPGMGIQFTDFENEKRKQLVDYVNRYNAKAITTPGTDHSKSA